MKKHIIGLLACLIPGTVLACGAGEQAVFSCLTDTNKQVKVCQGASAISFRYGKPGQKPELVLSEKNTAFVWEHGEGGAGIADDLMFKNGSTAYGISHVANDDPLATRAHISINRLGKDTAYVECTSAIRLTPKNIKARSRAITEQPPSY